MAAVFCVLPARAQTPLQLGVIDSIHAMSGPVWAPHDGSLLVTSGGRIWQISVPSGTLQLVTLDSGFSGTPRFSRGGTTFAVARNKEVWLYHTLKQTRIRGVQGDVDSRWDLSPDGRKVRFAGTGYLWSRISVLGQHARVKKSPEMFGHNQLMIDKRVVAEEPGITWIFSPYGSPLEWSPDGTRLYFLSARTGWSKIWSINARGSDLRQETFGVGDDRDFQILNDHSIVFVSNRHLRVEWSLWRQERGKDATHVFGDWGTVQSPAVSHDGSELAFLYSTPTKPPEVYLHNFREGTTRCVTQNAPRTLFASVVPARVFRFPSSNRIIEGVLYVPNGVDSLHPAPAILKLHGGPSMHDGLSWNSQHQFLASRGFIVLAVNYSGSVGYGNAFEESDRLRIGYEDCDDIAAAATALQKLPFVRADKLGVWGSSYGGYLTNLVIGRYPKLFSAAVSWFGITNWFTNDAFPHLHPVVKYFFRDRMGDPATQKELYRIASPVTYASAVATPILLAHGDADTVVPIGQSEEFYALLKKHGAHAEFSPYQAEGHGWSRPDTRHDAFLRMEQWFNRYLQEN